MGYRNKTYVIFDAGDGEIGDKDLCYYRTMTMWKASKHIDFDFHNVHEYNNITDRAQEAQIKKKLSERFAQTKQVIVLVGENTKGNDLYVKWEIEVAKELNLPIIVANVNEKRQLDREYCPDNLIGANCMHVSFNAKIIQYAMDNFPESYAKKDKSLSKDWSYLAKVYTDLGLD